MKSEGVFVRGPYDGKRVRVTVNCGSETRTKQSFKDECNINKIVARYRRTGQLPVRDVVPRFMDCVGVGNYYEASLQVKAAEEAFRRLPSEIRKHFDNDPGKLVDAVQDPERREELVKLGLFEKSPAEPEKPAAEKVPEKKPVEAPVVEDLKAK